MNPAMFLIILGVILGIGHAVVGWRLLAPMKLAFPWSLLAWGLLVVSWITPLAAVYFFINRIRPDWNENIAWVGYSLLGLFFLVLAFVVVRDVGWGVVALAKKLGALVSGNGSTSNGVQTVADPERRQFLMRATGMGVLGVSGMFAAYGFAEARRRPLVEHVTVPIRNLHPDLEGFRIAQFTDLHVGQTIKRDFVETVVDAVNDLGCDLIAFTGDLVDGSVARLRDDVAPLSRLAAPYGSYFITGNHEYYSGVEQWIDEAKRLGFDVLHNEHRIIRHKGAEFVLAGVTDYSAGRFGEKHRTDPEAALRDAPSDIPRILLAHQPRSIDAAAALNCDLQLSGHTHGGQIYPFHYLTQLVQPYISGLHKHGDSWIYVSKGTGYWGPPIRVGAPAEVAIVELVRDTTTA